ncbi:transcription factor bHLH162-like [Eucalyptus grandis]|uniref:transcription factor bHLH162-like n=1 Tax=Eucalyptus grandis TaxID=71139 RepID=UPI00192EFACF|nr:transcription factor bHLH162-like [Eucalyptus grandis]XP_039168405.1 transcription factor bHLH162-like [Eucalyptus grandis]
MHSDFSVTNAALISVFSNSRRGMMESKPGSSRHDRKTRERNRRNQMKALFSELHSLVPPWSPTESTLSLSDQLSEAANYIKSLKVKVEEMREQKQNLLEVEKINTTMNNGPMIKFKSPEIRIWNTGSILEVVLVTGLDDQFMFNETAQVIHEEGADIVNASFSYVGDAMLHTFHAKVGEGDSPDERISERLRKIVNDMLMEFHP